MKKAIIAFLLLASVAFGATYQFTSSSTTAIFGTFVQINESGTALTSDTDTLSIADTSTYNTTGGAITHNVINVNPDCTRSSGANALTCVGINVQWNNSAQNNYAIVTQPQGRVGVGVAAPTVMMDIRSDRTITGDPGYVESWWTNSATAAGNNFQAVRQRGAMGSPTTTLATDTIVKELFYGVNTGNTLTQGAEFDITQDQSAGASAVPMSWQWSSQDTAGTMRTRLRIDSAGHLVAPQGAAPTASSCGASPTVSGSDISGNVVVGGSITTCTITFATSYATPNPSATADCNVVSETGGDTFVYSVSNTAITMTGVTAARRYHWKCIGF
jgi:hypothetical protein